MDKSKMFERTLGDLIAVLTEEGKRFVCNKRAHQFSPAVFTNLVTSTAYVTTSDECH